MLIPGPLSKVTASPFWCSPKEHQRICNSFFIHVKLVRNIYTSNASAVPVGICNMPVLKGIFRKVNRWHLFSKKIISSVWSEGRGCMSDHTEGDTEMWSSKYVFGNTNNPKLKNIYFILCCREGVTETDSVMEK